MSFGVMGGNMQPQGHLQTLVRMLVHGQQPQAACDAPRWKVETGLKIDIEHTMAPALVEACAAWATSSRRRRIRTWTSAPASSSGAERRRFCDDGYVAASDSAPRRAGPSSSARRAGSDRGALRCPVRD
jgi:gamma-glutamyltranspeptidase/glutathione hydrolase